MTAKNGVARKERRLGYRRHIRNEKAVSPVVATLILILIAVAAAAALYLWLTGWQAGVTKGIGSPHINSNDTFSIGGSTTVYPMSELAIKWFEQNNSNVSITDQQGGSVAGAEAYCAGQVTVGAASSSFTTAQLAGDGCSTAKQAATVQTVVGVDAIVGIVSTKNPGISAALLTPVNEIASSSISFNATTMFAIYWQASSTVGVTNTGTFPGLGAATSYTPPTWLCGGVAPLAYTPTALHPGAQAAYLLACPSQGHAFPWSSIPFPAGCNDHLVAPVAGACTYPYANQNATTTYDRLDSSGTEQGFSQKYTLIPKDGSGNSCGTDNQLVSCNIIATHHEEGNPLLASSVAGDANGIGFNSFGIAYSTPGLYLAGYSNDISSTNTLDTIATQGAVIQPSVTTVLVDGYRAANTAAAYGPWRVLEYLTDGTPTSSSPIGMYINFVLGPEVNLNLCTQTGYISLYAA